jgi:hypothetical protein
MEIRPVGAELFHAYGRIDMTKPTVAPRNFAKAYKMIRNGEMENVCTAWNVAFFPGVIQPVILPVLYFFLPFFFGFFSPLSY